MGYSPRVAKDSDTTGDMLSLSTVTVEIKQALKNVSVEQQNYLL